MIPRIQEKRLVEMLGRFPVVAVVGPRQVGKSTLVQGAAVARGRRYVSLDDFDALGLAQRDPKTLLASADAVTIDEVQRCPELLRGIKAEVDRDRRNGRFLLTGSSDLNLTAGLAAELAGRVGVLALPPITWRETSGRLDPPAWLSALDAGGPDEIDSKTIDAVCAGDLPDALLAGGYPLSLTASDAAARRDWFENYRYTYLERDVRQVSQIGNLADFARLLNVAAARTAGLLNAAALARDVGLSAATCGRYLSLLEATFQIVRLPPWFANLGTRAVKSPKLYWADTGLAAHLLGIETKEEMAAQHLEGALVETFVMMEILKQTTAFAPAARLHFVRTHGGLEIDGVLVRGRRRLPFEIKAGATVRPDDARPLLAYLDREKNARVGLILHGGSECRRLDARVWAVPFRILLA